MELLSIITMLALLEFIWMSIRVGAARGKYNIKAPAIAGDEMFERHYRVHYNTLEQLVVFLPALWAFGYYVGEEWAAGLGCVYLVGRIIYAITYVKDPAKRGPGFLLSVLPAWILLLGSLVGAVWRLVTG
jgi:uncharacterized membrane protein YecN with MAPEG domain